MVEEDLVGDGNVLGVKHLLFDIADCFGGINFKIANQIFLHHLPDDLIVSQCHLQHGGCIVLQIRADPEAPSLMSDSRSNFRQPTPQQQPTPELQLPSPLGKLLMTQDISSASNTTVTLSLKADKYWTHRMPMNANLDETVLKLKHDILQVLKIFEDLKTDNVPVERMVVHAHSTGVELVDYKLLGYYAVSDHHEIALSVKEP